MTKTVILRDRNKLTANPDVAKVKKLRTEIASLISHIDESYVEVASRLWQVKSEFSKCSCREQAKGLLGHETMECWLEEVVGERSRRRAFYYLSIWKRLHEQAGVGIKELREIGWMRAKEVARIARSGATEATVRKWAEKAKTTPPGALVEAVKVELAANAASGKTLPSERVHVVRFGLYDNQHAAVIAALDLAKTTGTDKPGEALTNICQEFLGSAPGWVEKPQEERLSFLLANIERHWGVKVLALDAKTRAVRYGEDTLAWIGKPDKELTHGNS